MALMKAAFCVALVVSGVKTQTQRIDTEEETTPAAFATTTKNPATENELVTAVQNVTSITKSSEEETTLSTTSATSRQKTVPTTSQSSAPTTTTSMQTKPSELESTQSPPSLAQNDQLASSQSPSSVISWPVIVAMSDQRHPNAVSAASQNYQGKNDFSNFVNTVEYRKNVYNQMYRHLQQEREQYMQSILFSGLLFDI